MRNLLTAFVVALSMAAAPVAAQTVEDINASIDMVLGDHTKFDEAFEAVQAAISEGDANLVADWVAYPITVNVEGEELTLDGPDAFIAQSDSIMSGEIAEAVTGQRYEELFVSAEGVMFGNGQMWLGGVCRDDNCAEWDVRIITLQGTALE